MKLRKIEKIKQLEQKKMDLKREKMEIDKQIEQLKKDLDEEEEEESKTPTTQSKSGTRKSFTPEPSTSKDDGKKRKRKE